MAKNKVSKNGTSNKKSNKSPRERKRKKRVLKIIVFLLVISIIIACGYLLLKHPVFNIDSFNLEGTDRYTIEEIASKLEINVGSNIFIESVRSNKKNISSFPYIENIKFKYVLPNVLEFQVIERKSKYLAFDIEKNKYFKLDENGYILEETTIDKKNADELLIYGITFDDEVVLGDKINDIDMSKIIVFLEINEEFIKSKINRNITRVNFENSLTTLTLNDKLNVIFPNKENLNYKMAVLSEILKSIGEDAGGVLDLTKNNPTYSSF